MDIEGDELEWLYTTERKTRRPNRLEVKMSEGDKHSISLANITVHNNFNTAHENQNTIMQSDIGLSAPFECFSQTVILLT
jgi:hypothetical protein